MKHALHWFRTDLRVHDNTALQSAMQQAESLITTFIITPTTWKKHSYSPRKVQFILESLEYLSQTLAQQHIPLIIDEQPNYNDCVNTLISLCSEYSIDAVYFNKQYELDEARRDEIVINMLTQLDIQCFTFDDQTIVPARGILTPSGESYKIFTPFKNAWIKKISQNLNVYSNAISCSKKFNNQISSSVVPKKIHGFTFNHIKHNFLAGEKQALQQLNDFCDAHIKNYHLDRDFPALNRTSKLSPALAIGTLSAKHCLAKIIELTHGDITNDLKYPGELCWLSELIWRDFYKHIIFYYPDICRHKPYKPMTDKLSWKSDPDLLTAWQQGRTGFPLVDAAMRQLNQTGWMHNRLRMVTAMFFTKTLFLDWRLGEQYFMENLIDGDFAANNGGWQWCASTGTDAAPYFRIFNPITQSERCDPHGTFIRQYCPEISMLNDKQIHDPYTRGVSDHTLNYPKPIVDYKAMRHYVIEQFKRNLAVHE